MSNAKSGKLKGFMCKMIFLAVVYAFLILLFKYVLVFAVVRGSSMENTLHEGDVLFCSRINKEYKRGDIVLIKVKSLNENIIKRVIAVSGDNIEIRDNKVYINNEEQKESYIKEAMITTDMSPVIIPENSVFVMGDNRNNSLDSRRSEVGIVSTKEQVFGKSICKMSLFQYIVLLVALSGLVLFTDSIISSDFSGKTEKEEEECEDVEGAQKEG